MASLVHHPAALSSSHWRAATIAAVAPRPDAHGQVEVQLRVVRGAGWRRWHVVGQGSAACRRGEQQQLELDLPLALLLHGRTKKLRENKQARGISACLLAFLLGRCCGVCF